MFPYPGHEYTLPIFPWKRNRSTFEAKGVDNIGRDLSCSPSVFWLPSSMVEQLTLNQLVRGSSPRGATILSCSFPPRPCQSPGRRRISLSRRRSSTVEHLFCKQAVAGSNPIAGSRKLPRSLDVTLATAWWCNGSTADSESVCLGSIPSRAANAGRANAPLPEKRVVNFLRVCSVGIGPIEPVSAITRNYPPALHPCISPPSLCRSKPFGHCLAVFRPAAACDSRSAVRCWQRTQIVYPQFYTMLNCPSPHCG